MSPSPKCTNHDIGKLDVESNYSEPGGAYPRVGPRMALDGFNEVILLGVVEMQDRNTTPKVQIPTFSGSMPHLVIRPESPVPLRGTSPWSSTVTGL